MRERDTAAEIAHLNAEAAQKLIEETRRFAAETINLAFNALKLKLLEDQQSENMPFLLPDETEARRGRVLNVLEDVFAAPRIGSEGRVRTLSLLLGRVTDEDTSESPMAIYFPFESNQFLSELDVDELEEPDRIIVERKPPDVIIGIDADQQIEKSSDDARNNLARYIVGKHSGLEVFLVDTDSDEQVLFDEVSGDRFEVFFDKRVDTGLPFMARLREELINLDVLPQRFVEAETGTILDLSQ